MLNVIMVQKYTQTYHPAAAARVDEDLLTGSVKVIVNLNAFAILPENKRVDIDIDIAVVAIADNIVKNNYINMLPKV
jgi:hypothetical protein